MRHVLACGAAGYVRTLEEPVPGPVGGVRRFLPESYDCWRAFPQLSREVCCAVVEGGVAPHVDAGGHHAPPEPLACFDPPQGRGILLFTRDACCVTGRSLVDVHGGVSPLDADGQALIK